MKKNYMFYKTDKKILKKIEKLERKKLKLEAEILKHQSCLKISAEISAMCTCYGDM